MVRDHGNSCDFHSFRWHTFIIYSNYFICIFCLGEAKFYVVFLLVNNYAGDVVVSTGLPGTSGQIKMKQGDTFAVSEQPNNANPISVTAVDRATFREVSINGRGSASITPAKIFGASFQVLFLYREDPGK